MIKYVWILSILLLIAAPMLSQDVIENSDKPQNPNAGRVLELEEDLLLRFDGSGKFIHNFFKKGQGPGELMYQRGYVLRGGKLCVIGSIFSRTTGRRLEASPEFSMRRMCSSPWTGPVRTSRSTSPYITSFS